jgi:hypothetical protein
MGRVALLLLLALFACGAPRQGADAPVTRPYVGDGGNPCGDSYPDPVESKMDGGPGPYGRPWDVDNPCTPDIMYVRVGSRAAF